MQEILIISGKGGTGKTILTASFATLAKNKVIVDCDVDAANMHLLMKPTIKESHDFIHGKKAEIDKNKCILCGKCIDFCHFDAIDLTMSINPIFCEGCGLCSHICPSKAITMKDNIAGEYYISDTDYGTFIHAKLGIAQGNSGKLVTKLKQIAKQIAEKNNNDYVIIDGSPGIGCPVIASISGADKIVIVTEPSLSGIHDFKRVFQLSKSFNVIAKVVINKYDLNMEMTEEIIKLCNELNIEVLGTIPFSLDISNAINNFISPVIFCNGIISQSIKSIWSKTCCQ